MKRVVRQGNDRGFTLVELIISMVVVSIALGGVLTIGGIAFITLRQTRAGAKA